jgi:hypothetical protein
MFFGKARERLMWLEIREGQERVIGKDPVAR